jgi:fucose permease
VTLTPERIGSARTTAMVGYQLAAASLGAGAVPWLVGRGIAATSLEALGPMLLVAAALMTVLHVSLERLTADRSTTVPR